MFSVWKVTGTYTTVFVFKFSSYDSSHTVRSRERHSSLHQGATQTEFRAMVVLRARLAERANRNRQRFEKRTIKLADPWHNGGWLVQKVRSKNTKIGLSKYNFNLLTFDC